MFGLPGCWSVNGAELYARLHIPEHIRSITIYSQHGTAAATAIAKAEPHLAAGGRGIEVRTPPPGGAWTAAWPATCTIALPSCLPAASFPPRPLPRRPPTSPLTRRALHSLSAPR